jgi:tryptophan 7-halogenase
MIDAAAPRKRIVIVGDGLAAWMAAAALSRTVRLGDWQVRVIGGTGRDDMPLTAADATLPSPAREHGSIALDEDRIVADNGAAFTFGIALSGWSQRQATYFHPFGSIGAALGPLSFHHLVTRLRREGIPMRLANFSLPALAAQAGRFARPDGNPRSVLSTCRYGLHLDYAALRGDLRRAAEAAGIAQEPAPFSKVEHAADGSIAAVATGDGRRIEGDLFIDCTGVAARLIGSEWQDWSPWLPCNRVLAATVEQLQPPLPYSHSEAQPAGWIRHLPTQGRIALTAHYSADVSNDEQALAWLRAAGNDGDVEVRAAILRFGRRRQAWHRNCVALGSAAAMIDPVGVTNLQLLRSAIGRLMQLLPGDPRGTAEAAEFNRLTGMQLDHARDFAMLHYKLNGRNGEPFWDACRSMDVPSTLEYKMRLYEGRGRIALYDEEPLEDVSWMNLYDEHGVLPRRYSPIADGFSVADLKAHADRARTIMIDELGRMPRHGDYLARVKAAGAPGRPAPASIPQEARHRVGRFMGDSA